MVWRNFTYTRTYGSHDFRANIVSLGGLLALNTKQAKNAKKHSETALEIDWSELIIK